MQQYLQQGLDRPRRFSCRLLLVPKDGMLPLTGQLMHPDCGKLQCRAKLVHYERALAEEVRGFVQQQELLSQAGKLGLEAQTALLQLFQRFLPLEHVADMLGRWRNDAQQVQFRQASLQPVKILLYGGTGEGKSSLVSALLDMPGIAPSDCSGTAVTSCTMIYSYREYARQPQQKPRSEHPEGWAEWLAQGTSDSRPTMTMSSKTSATKRFGARLHFLSPAAFRQQRHDMVACVAEYWLHERKECKIPAKLPANETHEAFFATQRLQEWYGARFAGAAQGWRNQQDMLQYLQSQDSTVKGLQLLFGMQSDQTGLMSLKRSADGSAVYVLEENDLQCFCEQLRDWVTVNSANGCALPACMKHALCPFPWPHLLRVEV